jgi:hypothetical protein
MQRIAFLLLLASYPLHASFVTQSCVSFTYPSTCTSAPDSGTINPAQGVYSPNGATTYTYQNTATGQVINGKVTMGTSSSATVTDPNGVPVIPFTSFPVLFESVSSFTDTVGVSNFGIGNGPITWNFNLHTNIDPNNIFSGFYAKTQITLGAQGFDAQSNPLWVSTNIQFNTLTFSTPGSTNNLVTFTGASFWDNPLLASMAIQVELRSSVSYTNFVYPNGSRTNAASTSSFADASHTLILQSIQAPNGSGGNPTFTSQNGANYSTSVVPEPGPLALVSLGILGLILKRPRQSNLHR